MTLPTQDHGEFIDDQPFDDEDDGLAGADCGMGEDGQCQYAGTEECDECPYWDDEYL